MFNPGNAFKLDPMSLAARFTAATLTSPVGIVFAADTPGETGVSGSGAAIVLFVAAAALLFTLLIRSAAGHLSRVITSRAGSRRVRRALDKRSPDVLHDFVLPGAYGGLVKIDHAIMTAGGILCIQAKHCKGLVFGGEDEPQWTNIDGRIRHRFLNPVIQNEGRTRALQKIVPDVPVANLVVFTGRVDFPTPPPKNVIPLVALDGYIAKFVFGPSKISDWDSVWMSVKSAALTDPETRKDMRAQLSFS